MKDICHGLGKEVMVGVGDAEGVTGVKLMVGEKVAVGVNVWDGV